MRIQLLNAPTHHYAGSHYRLNPGLGLPIIAAVLEQHGHEAEVWDLEALRISPASLGQGFALQRDRWPDAVGVHCSSYNARGVREILKALRDAGFEKHIVVGGPHVTIPGNAGRVLAWGADCVVIGECEGNVDWVFSSKRRGVVQGLPLPIGDVPGPLWEKHLPHPVTYLGNQPKLGHPEGISMWGRGCPHNCLVAGTPIRMTDGSEKMIEAVVAGDWVMGMHLSTGYARPQLVQATMLTGARQQAKVVIDIESNQGSCSITCTVDHLVWTRRGWIRAVEIRPNEEVTICGQTEIHDHGRRTRAQTAVGQAASCRREVWTQETNVRRREAVTCEASAKPRSQGQARTMGQEQQGSRIFIPTCEEDERGRHSWSQDADFGGRATRDKRTYEAKQSNEQSDDSPQSISNSQERMGRRIVTSRQETECGRAVWSAWRNERRSTGSSQPENAGSQSHAYPGGRRASSCITAREISQESQVSCGTLDKSGNAAKQGGAEVDSYSAATRVSVCGRRGFLDRPMPEWQMSESRFPLWIREKQDGHFAARRILAQETRQQPSGTAGLSEYGLEDSDNLVEGIARRANDYTQSVPLVGRVIRITRIVDCRPVYDLQTWPDHNFFAGNVLVHNCIFCANPVFGRHKTRFRPAGKIRHDMQSLRDLGARSAFVYDDQLVNGNGRQGDWLQEVCEQVAPLRMTWKCQGRCSEKLELGTLKAMRAAGCRAIMWGIESFSDAVLENLRKETTEADIWHSLRLAKQAGIGNWAFLMVGNYRETVAELAYTGKQLAQAQREGLVQWRQVTVCTPYPGSELWSMAEAEGWLVAPPETGPQMGQAYAPTPWLSQKQIGFWKRRLEVA